MDDFAIERDGLRLRRMTVEDAAIVQRCRNLPGVSRLQAWRPETVDEVAALAREQIGRRPGGQREPFQIVIALLDGAGRETVVGDMGTGAFDPGRQMEIGLVVDPAHQGQGVATRACRLLFDHLFAHGLHRVVARVDPRNAASLRLFDGLGFRREGHERACWWDAIWREWTDEIVLAMLAEDWRRSGRSAGA